MQEHKHSFLFIGYENNILKVSVDMSVAKGQLQCTFLSGFTGSARCRIEYFLQTMSGVVVSTEFGSAGDTVPVDLDLLLNAEYTYTATLVDASAGTTPVVVMGTFTTQCGKSCAQRIPDWLHIISIFYTQFVMVQPTILPMTNVVRIQSLEIQIQVW